MSTAEQREWLDAAEIADTLKVRGGVSRLRLLAKRGKFPELLHVDRGEYRVRRVDYEAWERGNMTSAEAARDELHAERVRAATMGRA